MTANQVLVLEEAANDLAQGIDFHEKQHRPSRGRARHAQESSLGTEATWRAPPIGCLPNTYFTTAPAPISPSTVTNLRVSPMEAASSMPSDFTPRSLAGFRLATTTMVFPTNSLGV